MNNSSRTWGTQEQAIAAVRGASGRIYRSKTFPIVAVIRERESGRFTYAVWVGNACKPTAYFSAASLNAAQECVAYYWKQAEATMQSRAERVAKKAAERAELKASDHYTVGDVLANSWGYDQTNVDFYQVTHVGAKTIKIRELAQKASDAGGGRGGKCQPDRYNFIGEEMVKTVHPGGRVSFQFGGASKWDGRPMYYSHDH